ncbi:RHS repeat protein, partial [Acidiluteibacter ferrifornacis]
RIRTAITDYMLSPYETDNLVFTPIEESEEMEMELESEISNGPEYAPNPEMSMELTSPNQLIVFRGANGKTYSTTLGAFYEGEEASKAPDASSSWTSRINLSGGADADWGTNGNVVESPEKVDYYRSDHLGNTRVVYEVEWDADLNQVKFNLKGAYDYFPYGKILRSYVPGNGYERYLTTQHERDHETISGNFAGTGLDNRGARFYDSDVARFLSVDPLAAKYPSLSAYNYVAGNPVILVDTDGREIRIYSSVNNNTSSQSYIVYTPGMKAAGSQFQIDAINALNHMNASKSASGSVSRLTNSSRVYDVYDASTNTSETGSGTINNQIYWQNTAAHTTNTPNSRTGSNKEAASSPFFHEVVHKALADQAKDMYNSARTALDAGQITQEEYEKRVAEADKIWNNSTDEEYIIEEHQNAYNEESGWGTRSEGSNGESRHSSGYTGSFVPSCSTCTDEQ